MRKQQITTAILLAIMAITAIYQATRPDSGLLKFIRFGDTAYGHGGTNSMSVAQVARFLDDNPDLETLVLGYMPGTSDADMNLRIARDIRRRGMHTHLTKRSYIASGAVDLFLAGTKRTMECGARIGVHSWSSYDGTYYPAVIGRDPRQKTHEKFLSEMGIDQAFYVFTREAAPPQDIYLLKPADIERFGLLTQASNC